MVSQWKLKSSVMRTPIQPLTWLVVVIAGWVQRDQQAAIVYLLEKNRVLKARLRGRKLRSEHVNNFETRKLHLVSLDYGGETREVGAIDVNIDQDLVA